MLRLYNKAVNILMWLLNWLNVIFRVLDRSCNIYEIIVVVTQCNTDSDYLSDKFNNGGVWLWIRDHHNILKIE